MLVIVKDLQKKRGDRFSYLTNVFLGISASSFPHFVSYSYIMQFTLKNVILYGITFF